MKKIILITILSLSFITFSFGQMPFTKGVNLTGWFQAANSKAIPFSTFTKQDFINIKSLGCDIIRLPINLHYMTNGAPDYQVDPLLFFYLDQAVDWAEELQLYLIIDNHTIDDANNKSVEIPLLKIWPQMAQHFKNRSKYVMYEILNEPHTLLVSDWSLIQQKAINIIRQYDTFHTILVTGADWGGVNSLGALPYYTDSNLLYSFHFYDPMLFTHQGASWTSPSLTDLAGVPFPYDAAKMPTCPNSLKGTWVEGSLATSYKTEGTVTRLQSAMNVAINFATQRNVNVFCGELGVYNRSSNATDRVSWYSTVTSYLTNNSIPWTMWDYQGAFGLFNKGSEEMFEYDVNVPLAQAIGFIAPPQKVFTIKPDSVEINLYLDYVGQKIIQSSPAAGTVDLFDIDSFQGNYALFLTDMLRYSAVNFDFKPNKDLSLLVSKDFALDFWIKGTFVTSQLTLRFLDTKTTDPLDHPWRNDFVLKPNLVSWDGEWQHVNIPLKSFVDIGSWDGSWYSSTNSFDWKAVDRFQIVAENMDFLGKKFWIDNLRITDNSIYNSLSSNSINTFDLNIYPNPVSNIATIDVTLEKDDFISIKVYDLQGDCHATLYNGFCDAGNKRVVWDLKNSLNIPLTNGIYLCKLTSSSGEITRKVVVINWE